MVKRKSVVIVEKYLDGKIDSDTFAHEYTRAYAEEMKHNDPDLIQKYIETNDPNTAEMIYRDYLEAQKVEQIKAVRKSMDEFHNVLAEFDRLMATDIRESTETKEQQIARLWTQNPELWTRYERASRDL